MGKDVPNEQKKYAHLVDLMLHPREAREKSSISDVHLAELKNRQKKVRLLRDLELRDAETDRLKEELQI